MTQRKPPEGPDDYLQSVLTGMLELAEREAGRALTQQERRAVKEEYLAAGGLQPAVPRRQRKTRRRSSVAEPEYRWQAPHPVRQWRRRGD